MNISKQTLQSRQQGVALIVAMVFLMLLTIIGITAMSTSSLQEKMAGNVQDKHVAFQAAESALRAGEAYLAITNPLPPFDGTVSGLYQPEPGGSVPKWDSADWSACGTPPTGIVCLAGVAKVKTQPKYIIEELGSYTGGSSTASGTSLRIGHEPPQDTSGSQMLYRVTARGTGGTDAALAQVQSVFRK
jgi:type IV pilus assembly protein PilX